MKRYISFRNTLLAAFLATASGASSQSFQWARNFNNTSGDIGYSIATDADGNVYTAGYFDAQLDITGSPHYTAGSGDGFIVKHAPNGTLLWGKSIGGTDNDHCRTITVDLNGNVYVAGSFSGTADLDPNAGVHQLTSNGHWDVFLLKLDGNGNFLWVKQFGGGAQDEAFAVATGLDGSVYVSGDFGQTVTFGPGYTFTEYGNRDVYVAKLDANGNFLWAQHVGGSAISDVAYALAVDDAGDLLVGGVYMGTMDFDPSSNVTELTGYGSFIEKLSPSGDLIWVKGTPDSQLTSLDTDGAGNVIATGFFFAPGPGWTTDFDPGNGVFNMTVSEGNDVFIQKLDSEGDFIWARQLGGGGYEAANGVAVDRFDNIYVAGSYFTSVDFDPGAGSYELTSEDFEDLYILQLHPNGTFGWVEYVEGMCSQVAMGIALDADANILTTGYFNSGTDFNSDAPVAELIANAGNDMFVFKLGKPDDLGTSEALMHALRAWPNPNDGSFVLDLGKTYQHITLTITDVNGNIAEARNFSSLPQVPIAFNAPAGVYFLSVETEEGNAVMRIVKQ